MSKGKIVAIFLSVVTFLAVATNYTFAQTNPTVSPSSKAQKYCTRAVATVDKILSQSSSRLTNRQKYINDRKKNIQDRINTLQSKSGKVDTLQTDANQFFSSLEKWYSDYQKYLSLIQASQSLTCGSSDGQFAQTIQSARAQLKIVNQDSSNLKSFYQNTLNQDFANARLSIKNSKGLKNGTNKTK